jgi:hypothetical protein
MRRMLAGLLVALGACSPTPSPIAPALTAAPPAPVAATPTSTQRTSTHRTPAPTASLASFRFDVENHASVGVVVSVASDTAATMPGFEPGQRGTVSIALRNPQNGISVEIQASECRVLAEGRHPTPVPFTLLVEDGPEAGTVRLSTRAGASGTPIPLPANSLVGCGG